MPTLKLVLYTFLILFSTTTIAQPTGFSALKNVNALQQALLKNSVVTHSITSDFTQVKTLKLLAEDMNSKGRFYYKKPEKMRIEYSSPYKYLVIYGKGNMKLEAENSSSRINTRSSQIMESLKTVMLDCMTGNIFSNKDFRVKAFENSKAYALFLEPTSADMAKLFKGIEVQLNKSNLQVNQLTLNEKGGDATVMNFTNTVTNKALNESLFSTR